jgi:hypothetical protein
MDSMGMSNTSFYTSPAPLMASDRHGSTHLSSMPRESSRRTYTSSQGSAHSHPRGHPRHNPLRRPDDIPCPDGYFHNKSDWMNPLCHEPENDVNTCCMGCWCPQNLYGRTQYRLQQIAENKDPLDLKDFKIVNAPCGLFWIVGAFTNFDCKLKLIWPASSV